MNNLRNTIKSAYNGKVVRDYFSFDYQGKRDYHINFNNDTGKWYFRVWVNNYPYTDRECVYESGMLTDGNKLTDAAIAKAAKLIEQNV